MDVLSQYFSFFLDAFFIRFHTLSLSQPCYLPSLLILFLTSLLITAPPLFEFERANLQDQTKKNIHTLCFLGLICDTYFTLFFCYSLTLIVHTSSTPSMTSDARTSYLFIYLNICFLWCRFLGLNSYVLTYSSAV